MYYSPDIMWSFIWNGKTNQINRNVCCLETNLLYPILHSPLESWNAIGKFWLHKLDFKCNEKFIVCRCSNVSTLKLNNILSWSIFNNNLLQSRTIDEILEQRLSCNSNITFKNKPICFASFLKSNIRTIKDFWTTIQNDFKSCDEIYNSLNDKRNCISEYVRIKKAVSKEFDKVK